MEQNNTMTIQNVTDVAAGNYIQDVHIPQNKFKVVSTDVENQNIRVTRSNRMGNSTKLLTTPGLYKIVG